MAQWLDRIKFGNGKDGAPPSSLDTNNGNGFGSCTGTAGQTTLAVVDRHAVWRIASGDVILIHQSQGTGAGQWELNVADATFGTGTYNLKYPLAYSYGTGAQVVRVPQYTGGTLSATLTPIYGWNGSSGGIVALMSNGDLTISGSLNASGAEGLTVNYGSRGSRPSGGGFRGGKVDIENNDGRGTGQQGESYNADGGHSRLANYGGGGGADYDDGGAENWSAAGGAYATNGGNSSNGGSHQAIGGAAYGVADLSSLYFGSAGGGNCGGTGDTRGTGGNGGGIVIIIAKNITVSGTIYANGGAGGGNGSCKPGGAGAGGAILLKGQNVNIGTGLHASYGAAKSGDQQTGGVGGYGRIRIEYSDSISGSVVDPSASTAQVTTLKSQVYGGMI